MSCSLAGDAVYEEPLVVQQGAPLARRGTLLGSTRRYCSARRRNSLTTETAGEYPPAR